MSVHSDDLASEASPSQESENGFPQPGLSQINNSRVIPALASNKFAEEETYFTRSNRYFGPDSAWLSWTKEDTLVAQTLDHLRSQDLSIHLFNAYGLRREGQKSRHQNRQNIKGKGRAKSVDSRADSEADEAGGFVLPRTWTAWPLPPREVPRETDMAKSEDRGTYAMDSDPRPSATLEDCLISITTRLARERWRNRKWAPDSHRTHQPDLKLEEGGDVEMQDPARQPSHSDAEAAETLSTDSESESEMFKSQPWDTFGAPIQQASKDKDLSDTSQTSFDRPTPIADDEAARSLLLPSTRHILSKLDDLLLGLHQARQSYATTTPHTSSKAAAGDTTDLDATDIEDSDTSTHQTIKRKRSTLPPSSSAKHARRSKVQLNPRDWSDIIGMAALTNWSPAVIDRASERCALLFNSNMLFRTFHPPDTTRPTPYFTEHFALSDSSSETEHDTKPTTVATRTSRACTSCVRLKEKCEPATISSVGVGACKRCSSNPTEKCTGITSTLQALPSSSSSTTCPHPTCPRHTIPFRKSYHLQRHLNDTHKSSPPPAPTTLPSSPYANSSSGAEILSSRIVCPLLSCPRHERGFSRGYLLYAHISKMHPEIDVEEVKRLEKTRRGDGRGRWRDERRRRSRSRVRDDGGDGVEVEE